MTVPKYVYLFSFILTTSIFLFSFLEQNRDPNQPKPMSHLLSAIYVLGTALVDNILDAMAILLKAIFADQESAMDSINIYLTNIVASQRQSISNVLYWRIVQILGHVFGVAANMILISMIFCAYFVAMLAVCLFWYSVWHGVGEWLRNDGATNDIVDDGASDATVVSDHD